MDKECFLVVTARSIVLVDESGKVAKSLRLSEDPESRARQLQELEEGKPPADLAAFLQDADIGSLVVETRPLMKAVAESGWGGPLRLEFPSAGGRAVRRQLAARPGGPKDSWETAHMISAEKVRRSYEDWDRLVIQAVAAIDELDRSMANLYARCRDWYSIHFPELERIVKSENDYANILLKADPRSPNGSLGDLNLPEERLKRIREAAGRSVGVRLEGKDLEAVRELARSMLYLEERKAQLHAYLCSLMERHAPSLTKVAEAPVGARLIARSGSIRKLAMMPSTSVQTLGAEKALFRHLTKGARPPKHGIIFQHPYVRNSPKSIRGKVASTLASKISLAARMDYITGEDGGNDLRASLDSIVKNLRAKAS